MNLRLEQKDVDLYFLAIYHSDVCQEAVAKSFESTQNKNFLSASFSFAVGSERIPRARSLEGSRGLCWEELHD